VWVVSALPLLYAELYLPGIREVPTFALLKSTLRLPIAYSFVVSPSPSGGTPEVEEGELSSLPPRRHSLYRKEPNPPVGVESIDVRKAVLLAPHAP